MAKLSVYYDETESGLVPLTLVIKFKKCEMDWNKSYLYIPLKVPFKRKYAEEFYDEVLSLSITQSELVVNPQKTGCFGIHIPTVIYRINKIRGEKYSVPFLIDDIEQLIIQMSDIEETLQMDINSIFDWR